MISFKTATANTLVPLQLEFAIPSDFIAIDSGDSLLGTIWGTKKDIDKILSQKPYTVGESERGFFRIFVSTNTAYFADKERFNIEDEHEKLKKMISNYEYKKFSIGGYPVLVQTGEMSGKMVFCCFIATLNETNVLTLLFHPPKKPTGKEMDMCKTLLSLISRPVYNQMEITGENASGTIKNILDKIQTGKSLTTELNTSNKIGPDDAVENPIINQKITFIEDKDGLKELTMNFSAKNKLLEKIGNAENIDNFSTIPWIIPELSGSIRIEDKQVLSSFKVKDKVENNPPIDIDIFRKSESPSISLLTGQPSLTSYSFKNFMEELLNMYEFKITGKTETLITLKGIPKKDEFLKIMKRIKLPLEVNGIDLSGEIMKRLACAVITVDPASYDIKSFNVDGMLDQFKYKFTLQYIQKER
ncbi:MAG: hypothetical protein A2X48_12500 [Lentisphaerae bacterium GWF2_49_21]|nr:MAG: hypothetical protein A2X48_12500 [Lentisphaerae bacterium GWF2_49_21]